MNLTPILSRLAQALPARLRVQMKQVRVIEQLDWDGPDIWLDVQNVTELVGRVKSCRKEAGTARWAGAMRSGDVFYDVGANIGVFSLIAGKMGATVHAFEPMAVTYGTLLKNIALNDLGGRITAWHAALSNENEWKLFNVSSLDSGTALHTLDRQSREGFIPVLSPPVMNYRLDEFVRTIPAPQPTHIKVDVEGAELEVLRGCGELLHRVQSLIVELPDNPAENSKVCDWLATFGLRDYTVHNDYPEMKISNWEFRR